MAFSRQEHWSGLPFSPPGDLPNPEIEPGSPALQADYLPSEPERASGEKLIPNYARKNLGIEAQRGGMVFPRSHSWLMPYGLLSCSPTPRDLTSAPLHGTHQCEVLQEWNYHLILPQRCAQKGTGVTGTSAPAAAPTPPAPSCREASLRLCGEATQGSGPAQGDAKQALLPQLKRSHSSLPVVTMATSQGGKTLHQGAQTPCKARQRSQ